MGPTDIARVTQASCLVSAFSTATSRRMTPYPPRLTRRVQVEKHRIRSDVLISHASRQKINAIILFLFFLLSISTPFSVPLSIILLYFKTALHSTKGDACEGLCFNHSRYAYFNILSFPRNAQFRRTKRKIRTNLRYLEYNNRLSFRKSSLYFYLKY